jgi:hypothetical protein
VRFHAFHNERAIEALLALALLEEQVIPTRTLHEAQTRTRPADPLLRAAVTFELGHW